MYPRRCGKCFGMITERGPCPVCDDAPYGRPDYRAGLLQAARNDYIREGIVALQAKLLEFTNFNASTSAPLPNLEFPMELKMKAVIVFEEIHVG